MVSAVPPPEFYIPHATSAPAPIVRERLRHMISEALDREPRSLCQIGLIQACLLHSVLDGIHGIGRIDGPVFFFIRFDQRCEHVEAIAFRRSWFRLNIKTAGNLLECPLIFNHLFSVAT